MKYLPIELKNEYHRLVGICPDIEEISSPEINVSDVLKAYCILAHYFSEIAETHEEKMAFGIRGSEGIGLLQSAIARQNVVFSGISKWEKPLDKCATLFFGIIKNHAFVDGNKRVALLILGRVPTTKFLTK